MTFSRPQKASSTVNGADKGRGRLICHLRLEERREEERGPEERRGGERRGKRGEERRGGEKRKQKRSHNISVLW